MVSGKVVFLDAYGYGNENITTQQESMIEQKCLQPGLIDYHLQ